MAYHNDASGSVPDFTALDNETGVSQARFGSAVSLSLCRVWRVGHVRYS